MPKTTQKTLKELLPVVSTYQTKLASEAKAILRNEAKDLFESFPHVEGIRWTQRRRLENSELAPVHKSDFNIDNIEYRLNGKVGARSVRRGDMALTDCGFDKEDDDWVSPWNDSRIENPDFLDTLTAFEEQLFDAESALAAAIGDYDRVTITRDNVFLDNL